MKQNAFFDKLIEYNIIKDLINTEQLNKYLVFEKFRKYLNNEDENRINNVVVEIKLKIKEIGKGKLAQQTEKTLKVKKLIKKLMI